MTFVSAILMMWWGISLGTVLGFVAFTWGRLTGTDPVALDEQAAALARWVRRSAST
jgi:hypothetical protein